MNDDDVRRLLAGARADEPVPADVVARLDATLAGLVADRGADPLADPTADRGVETGAGSPQPDAHTESPRRDARVVPLGGSPRRRARLTGLLAAAAAVVVAGVALGQLSPGGSDQADDADSAASAGRESAATESDGADREFAAQSDESAESDPEVFSGPVAGARDDLPEVSSASLRADLIALRAQEAGPRLMRKGCTVPGAGEVRDVTYDGLRAAVVLRPVEGAQQLAEVFACGTDEPLDSVVLPAP